MSADRPFTDEEYEKAKSKGFDLNKWEDYTEYFDLGEVDPDTGQRIAY